MQGIIIGTGVAVATVGAFWCRRPQTGWWVNDWVAGIPVRRDASGTCLGPS